MRPWLVFLVFYRKPATSGPFKRPFDSRPPRVIASQWEVNSCDDEIEAFEWSDRDPGHVVELQRTCNRLETVETMMELKEPTAAVDPCADEEGEPIR